MLPKSRQSIGRRKLQPAFCRKCIVAPPGLRLRSCAIDWGAINLSYLMLISLDASEHDAYRVHTVSPGALTSILVLRLCKISVPGFLEMLSCCCDFVAQRRLHARLSDLFWLMWSTVVCPACATPEISGNAVATRTCSGSLEVPTRAYSIPLLGVGVYTTLYLFLVRPY